MTRTKCTICGRTEATQKDVDQYNEDSRFDEDCYDWEPGLCWRGVQGYSDIIRNCYETALKTERNVLALFRAAVVTNALQYIGPPETHTEFETRVNLFLQKAREESVPKPIQ